METTATLTANTFKLSGNLKPLDKDIVQIQQDSLIMKKRFENKPKQIYKLNLMKYMIKSPKLNRCLLNQLLN